LYFHKYIVVQNCTSKDRIIISLSLLTKCILSWSRYALFLGYKAWLD